MAWLLGLAVSVRVLYLWQLADTPLSRHLVVDEAGYDRWARAVAAGDLLGMTPFYQAPLYPLALGGWYALFGPSAWPVRWLQAGAGVVTATLLYWVARRSFGAVAGRIAGVGAALYAPFLFYEGTIQKESWAVLFTAVLMLALQRAGARGTSASWTAAGAALGLLALLRENALAYAPALAAWLLLRRTEGGTAPRRRFLPFLLLAAGALAALLPVLLANRAGSGEWLLTTYQGGTNFHIGNHPGAPGIYTPLRPGRESPAFEGPDARAEAERRTGRSLTAAEVSRFWFGEGLRFLAGHPLEFAALLGRKLLLVWNAREIPDTWDLHFVARLVPILRGPLVRFGWVAPLALLGLYLAYPWRGDAAWLALLVAVTTLAVAAFYVFARYRLPLVPLLLPFAGHAVARLLDGARRRRGRWLAAAVTGLAACAVLVHIPTSALGLRFTDEVGHQNLGFLYQREGDAGRAEAEFRRALQINPDLGNAWLALARLLRDGGQPGAALPVYQGLLDHARQRRADGLTILDPQQEAEAELAVARAHRERGELPEAAAGFRRAAELLTDAAAPLVDLGITLRRMGLREPAAAAYRQALERDSQAVAGLLNLAALRAEEGDTAGARELLQQARAACTARRPELCAEIDRRLGALDGLATDSPAR